jgi:N-acetylglutamate synthase-like GNAT family acetyltransferase
MTETQADPKVQAAPDIEAASTGPGQVRKATLADMPGIQQLINANLDKLLPRPDDELRELIEDDLWWVIDEAGEIVGCCCLEVYSRKIAELRSLAVSEDSRGHGYGKQLVQVAVAEADRRNIKQVLVVTSTLQFFEAAGFGACLNEKYALFWNGTGRTADGASGTS